MISSTTKIVSISSAALGFGGLGLFGGNEISKKTISDSLGEVKLVSESHKDDKNVWSQLFSHFLLGNRTKSGKFGKLFFDWSAKISEKSDQIKDNSKELERLCKASSREIYSSLWGNNNDDLKSDVETFCSIKVMYITLSGKSFLNFSREVQDSTDKTNWAKNLDSLSKYTNEKPELDSELLSFKEKIKGKTDFSQNEEDISFLFKWCNSRMKSYYVNRTENNMDLLEKYCVRENSQSKK